MPWARHPKQKATVMMSARWSSGNSLVCRHNCRKLPHSRRPPRAVQVMACKRKICQHKFCVWQRSNSQSELCQESTYRNHEKKEKNVRYFVPLTRREATILVVPPTESIDDQRDNKWPDQDGEEVGRVEMRLLHVNSDNGCRARGDESEKTKECAHHDRGKRQSVHDG